MIFGKQQALCVNLSVQANSISKAAHGERHLFCWWISHYDGLNCTIWSQFANQWRDCAKENIYKREDQAISRRPAQHGI